MMRLAEIAVFTALAGGLHVAAFAVAPLPRGAGSSGGADGAASLTLAALPGQYDALADRWTAPPEVAAAPDLTAPEADAAPASDAAGPFDAVSTVPRPSAPVPPLPDRATLDTTPPAPATLSPDSPAPPMPDLPEAGIAPPRPLPHSTPRREAPARIAAADPPQAPVFDTSSAPPSRAPTASLRPTRRPATIAAPPTPVTRKAPAAIRKPAKARAAQRAKGAGGGATAKPAAKAAPKAAGPSAATVKRDQAQWGARIQSAVARAQRYPRGATATGTVKLSLTVAPSGRLAGVRIARSSGDAVLDRAAVSAAQRARIPRAPKTLTKGSYAFALSLRFAR